MQLLPLKSEKLGYGSDLLRAFHNALESANESVKEKDVIVIASKALAYSQGCLVECDDISELIKEEADTVIDEGEMVITMKNKILIPNAGIDNSNTPKGKVILWPEKPFGFARQIQEDVMNEYKIKKLGIIISDSHCQPLRAGTTGITIGWAGFFGVQDERNKKDLFGKKMEYTQIAMADNLSSAANALMGETNARIPFVIVRDAPVKFTDEEFSEDDYFVSPDKCIYRGIYNENLKI